MVACLFLPDAPKNCITKFARSDSGKIMFSKTVNFGTRTMLHYISMQRLQIVYCFTV